MVSPMNGRAELRDDKVITPFGDLAPRPDIRPEVLLRLSGKLQTTLELSQLLEIFLEEIQQAVLVDGLTFHHEPTNTTLAVGRNSLHTANYRLQTQQDYMGDMTFHRSTRFREHELANIEGLMTTLVYPLRNALRYHEALAAAFRDPLTGAGNRVALDKTLNREVRRLWESQEITVSRLKRVRYGCIFMPANVPVGTWVELGQKEVNDLYDLVDLRRRTVKKFVGKEKEQYLRQMRRQKVRQTASRRKR